MISDKTMVETLDFFTKQIKLQEIEDDIRSFLRPTKYIDHSVAKYLISRIGRGRVKVGEETGNNGKPKDYKFIKALKRRLQRERLNVIGDFINVLTNTYNRDEYRSYYKHLLLKELHELSTVNVNNWFDESRDGILPELFEEACRIIDSTLSELMKNIKSYPASLEEIKSHSLSTNEALVASPHPKVLNAETAMSESDLPY